MSIDSATEHSKSGAYAYLLNLCELEHLLEVLKDACRKRVMNNMQIREDRMNPPLQKVQVESPLTILHRLKGMEEGAA